MRESLTEFGGDEQHARVALPLLSSMKFANEALYGKEDAKRTSTSS